MALTQQQIETNMNERKITLAQLVQKAKENPLIDDTGLPSLYFDYAKECDVYKYCGCTVRIFEALDDEILNDTHGHKAFLEGFIDEEETITIIDYIKSYL